jgi:acetyl-CoA carboxylase carboxyl transferase subunit beta
MADKPFTCPACGKFEFDITNPPEAESISLGVCPSCSAHARLEPRERLKWLSDEDSFTEFDDTLMSLNPIDMAGYPEKLSTAQAKSSEKEAVVTGRCKIEGRDVIVAVMSFRFMGGSMGSVVGEKITRAILRGIEDRLPVFIFPTSGGARMQEGIFSLMQMAKTSAACAELEEAGLPLFIVVCDPTTGGVDASFAMLGDVIIAEPGALIGFAGQRVIEGTIRQKLPEGFQRAEFQLNHGFVDAIVPRDKQRKTFAFLIDSHARRQ